MTFTKSLNILSFFLIISQIAITADAYFYCSDYWKLRLCSKATRHIGHIACAPEQMPAGDPNYKLHALYPRSKKMVRLILELHNDYRNFLASGAVSNDNKHFYYPAAAQMRILIWDWELSYVASFNVKTCAFGHDKCRNTRQLPVSGQNLATFKTNYDGFGNHTMEFIIRKSIESWFAEANNTQSEEIVDKFENKPIEGKQLNNFANMISDQVSRVGCAISVCQTQNEDPKQVKKQFFFTCNYDYTAIEGKSLYQQDKRSATNCGRWRTPPHSKYSNLCNNFEVIFRDSWDPDVLEDYEPDSQES